jgi:two-component system, LytTR family, response regulator LytT
LTVENRIKIWIVEDEAIIAQNLRFTLEDLGYEVVGESYDYEQAREDLLNHDFDLAMLDINLGGRLSESGIVLANMLMHRKPVPYIFLTAYDDRDTILAATAQSPTAYLIKPANAAAIFAAIQTSIKNHLSSNPSSLEPTPPDYFFSKIGRVLHKVYWNEVAIMESTKNYVSLRLNDNKSEFLIRGSLVQVMNNMLPAQYRDGFVRISRSSVVHRSVIISVHSDHVETSLGELPGNEENLKFLQKNL